MQKIFGVNSNAPNYMDTAKADPTGRFYFGTYGEKLCGTKANNTLCSYASSEGVKTVFTGFKACFGLAFNDKTNKAYFMDSCDYRIYEFDWHRKTGQLSNKKLIYTFDIIPGEPSYLPFGLEIDRDNNFYVGSYGGGTLLKINLKQNCTERIAMPTFGGADLTDIFVTSCATYLDFNTGQYINNKKNCNKDLVNASQNKYGGSLVVKQSEWKGFPGNTVVLR